MRKHVGDTLIEVALAVGIFSMIAIAIASVMSGGTSGVQTALETTLAREEIDIQAEALRFIHSSYITDKDNAEDAKFVELWKNIIDSPAITKETQNPETDSLILNYTPTSCPDLYTSPQNNIFMQNAFVINPEALGTFEENNIGSVLIRAKDENNNSNNKMFREASTYPRLVYGKSGDNNAEVLEGAEGIYVIAVPELDTNNPTFYDFYIRTCWYGSNANEPSTISTLIRLHNPNIKSNNEN